jgi:hypothetical protein
VNRHGHIGIVVIRDRRKPDGRRAPDAYLPTLPVALITPTALNDPDGLERQWDLATIGAVADVYRVGLIGMTIPGRGDWNGRTVTGASAMFRSVRSADTRKSTGTTKVRTGATGRRGRAVTPWTAAERSLPRIWSRATAEQVARADELEVIARTSTRFVIVERADGRPDRAPREVSTVDGSQVIDPTYGALAVRSWCRRAALSGAVVTLD